VVPHTVEPSPRTIAEQRANATDPGLRAARTQALFRKLNEEIRRIADSFGVDENP
jgi:hypothetical protein